jgi:glutamine synthetase
LQNVPQCREDAASFYHSVITADMTALRKEADLLEQLTDKSYWPYPTYSDLLFY